MTKKEMLSKAKKYFERASIYGGDEIILEPKRNIYICIGEIGTELDFDCKMLEYLIRPAHKGLDLTGQKYFRRRLFKYFGVEWTQKEMGKIYAYIGCGVDRPLTKLFIQNGFDLSLLEERYENT